jgi:hypothetical protein
VDGRRFADASNKSGQRAAGPIPPAYPKYVTEHISAVTNAGRKFILFLADGVQIRLAGGFNGPGDWPTPLGDYIPPARRCAFSVTMF